MLNIVLIESEDDTLQSEVLMTATNLQVGIVCARTLALGCSWFFGIEGKLPKTAA